MSVFLTRWMSTMCVPSIHGGQKRMSDPLKLMSQMVGNHHIGTRN